MESLDIKTWYYYTREGFNETFADIGSATWIVKHEAGTNNYTATRFGYAMNDRTLTHAVGESWTWDGNPESCPANYSIAWAREFRYDGARARYLNRRLDPVALMAGNFVSLEDVWTDYDGSSPYGDYEVTPGNPPTVTNKRSYQPGMAVGEWGQNNALPTASSTDYYVTDHLGTTRGMTLPSGFPDRGATFTAFGERITGTQNSFMTRVGYVGAHGYQSTPIFETTPDSDIGYLHLGHRYYDPSTGRFLQRDPIGIGGGLNVYNYTSNIPISAVDPEGKWFWAVALVIVVYDMLHEVAEAPSLDDSPADFARRQRQRERETRNDVVAKMIPITMICKAAIEKAPKVIRRIGPSANPPPYDSPFPPQSKGPFYGGGQLWEPNH